MRIDDDRVERADRVGIDFGKEIRWLMVLEKSEGNGEEFVMDALGNL